MADQDVIDAKAGEMPGGDSSNPNLDPEKFDPDSENLIETVEGVGGVDVSMGGARDQSDDKTGDKPDDDKSKDDKLSDDEKAAAEKAEADKAEADKAAAEAGKPDEYHKDPAWQRIIKERDEALGKITPLEDRITALEKTPSAKEDDPSIVDINTLTNEQIAEWIEDDPKGYIANLQKLNDRSTKSLITAALQEHDNKTREESEKSKIDNTFDAYSGSNPDNKDGTGFVQMWESGKIQKFIDENPGHNAMSAHMKLTEEGRISKVREEATSKAKEEMTKEQQARIRTDGLGPGPAYIPADEKGELKDTKQKGGLVSVLANRLAKRRQG